MTEQNPKRRKRTPVHPKSVQEVTTLARTHGVEAMQRLIELMRKDEGWVALAASKAVLERAYGKVPQTLGLGENEQGIAIKIVRFSKEKADEHKFEYRAMPLVPGGREGSRDLGDGDGAGVRALPGQRADTGEQP
jgi:hypothetical protein